jgi:hypothetical protein
VDAAVTVRVVIVNVTDVAPAGTVTLVGTVPSVVELDASVTTAPPVGAARVSVTVPVTATPPVTAATFVVMPESAAAGGVTVTEAVPVEPFVDAVIVTEVFAATIPAVIVNVAVRDPAGTVTLTGTVATPVFDELSVTTLPPTGAFVESVTVPVVVAVDATFALATVTDVTFGPRIESVDFVLTPFNVAAIVAVVSTETILLVAVNVVDICPAGIVTVLGTSTDKLDDVRATTTPVSGAGPEIETSP